jgi:Holin of 3TMs, for gene-transfer release
MAIPALILAALPSVAKLLGGNVVGLVEKYINKEITRAELDAGIQTAAIESATTIAGHQANIIIAEAQGESWLQRNWRPMSALCFLWVAMWFAWLQPALYAWANVLPLRIGDTLLLEIIGLLKVCLGGYIGGRTLEKMATTLSGRAK